MKFKVSIVLVAILSGCASQPEDISTQYVSTLQYKDYDCAQLTGEAARVSRRASELHGSLEKTANNDAAQMGVGLILFWPTLFFLEGGDGAQAQEYSRLKGERDAIEQVSVQKKCEIDFKPLAPEEAPDNTVNANQ